MSLTALKGPLDPRSLAAFRISLGALLLIDLYQKAINLSGDYSDHGYLAGATVRNLLAGPVLSFHTFVGEPWAVSVLFYCAAGVAGAFLLGWRTRWTSILSYVCLVSVNQRNVLVDHAGDKLILVLMLWACVLPLEAAWSLDAKQGRVRSGDFGWAFTALQLQVFVVHFLPFISKLFHEEWWDGTALLKILHLRSYATELGLWTAQHPTLAAALGYGALVIEGVGPLLLFAKRAALRMTGVLVLMYLHVGISLTLSIGLFQLAGIASVLPLIPSVVWERLRVTTVPSSFAGPANRWRRYVIAAVGVCALTSSLANMRWRPLPIPPGLLQVGLATGAMQRWTMFSDPKGVPLGWFFARGQSTGGEEVAVFGGTDVGAPLGQESSLYSEEFWNHEQRMLWQSLLLPKHRYFRAGYARWLCTKYNAEHSTEPIERIALLYLPSPEHDLFGRVKLYEGPCQATAVSPQ